MRSLTQQLGPTWAQELAPIFESETMIGLRAFLKNELEQGATVYPRKEHVFRAFKLTPLPDVRVVWLGQDPYHGPEQAEGLAFSVRPGLRLPPSLLNIFKELQADRGIEMPQHGSLVPWALQGVLLLNTTLTVRAHEPLSHQGQGWEFFTDKVIELLAQQQRPICFVLLGGHARNKKPIITQGFSGHHIIEAVHPSPLSAHRGFMGSRIFQKIDDFLISKGESHIFWRERDFLAAQEEKAAAVYD